MLLEVDVSDASYHGEQGYNCLQITEGRNTVVCNLVKKQVSALSDTRESLSHVSESAENWLASHLPPMPNFSKWTWINYNF